VNSSMMFRRGTISVQLNGRGRRLCSFKTSFKWDRSIGSMCNSPTPLRTWTTEHGSIFADLIQYNP